MTEQDVKDILQTHVGEKLVSNLRYSLGRIAREIADKMAQETGKPVQNFRIFATRRNQDLTIRYHNHDIVTIGASRSVIGKQQYGYYSSTYNQYAFKSFTTYWSTASKNLKDIIDMADREENKKLLADAKADEEADKIAQMIKTKYGKNEVEIRKILLKVISKLNAF